MTKINTLLLSIIKRAKAICVAIKEVCYLQVKHQVKDILAIKNSPNTISMLSLPILLKVYVWCKKYG